MRMNPSCGSILRTDDRCVFSLFSFSFFFFFFFFFFFGVIAVKRLLPRFQGQGNPGDPPRRFELFLLPSGTSFRERKSAARHGRRSVNSRNYRVAYRLLPLAGSATSNNPAKLAERADSAGCSTVCRRSSRVGPAK